MMHKRTLSWARQGLTVLAAVAGLTGTATAMDEPRGKQAGDLVLGLGLLAAMPTTGGEVEMIGGKPASNTGFSPQVDATWFVTDYLALNMFAAATKHDARVKGSMMGDLELGHVWVMMPTLMAQFHAAPKSRISPYLGAGVTYALFFKEGGKRSAPVSDIKFDNEFGWAFNIGVDYEITPNWLANIDLKRIIVSPDVDVNKGFLSARANTDPWLASVAVRYRF